MIERFLDITKFAAEEAFGYQELTMRLQLRLAHVWALATAGCAAMLVAGYQVMRRRRQFVAWRDRNQRS